MEKKINNIIFKLNEECWIANFHFKGMETSFEVYKEYLDESLLEKILGQLEGKIFNLYNEADKVLTQLAIQFWGDSEKTHFTFSGFTIGLNQDDLLVDFRLCFHNSDSNNFNDYANWMVDIKDFKIIGCRREQL